MEYKHFSHHHNLNLYQVHQGQTFHCSGCETSCTSDSIYACWQCNFFLHDHCGNANRFIKHPSHPSHPLILLPSPTYCGGTFLCNACGATGKSFSYCCVTCEVDLHLHCAFLPPKVNHKSHPHELRLVHTIPEKEAFSDHDCKVCNNVLQSKQWGYCCVKCDDFHVHTFCATNEVKPGLYLDDDDDGGLDSGAVEATQLGHFQSGCEDQLEVQLSEEAVVELFKIQLQMQMAEQLAEILASPNHSSPA
ncbi:hypothetical protein LOK49_LG10G03014 [Camellia lanceoleosa]|uniref:Uncharacterized protein n=1 Tax=Camellia lanceoleosa TaxID=1840588 RepID=A0ACC0GEB4_9ERIC|nr:hypothetical protein LOK49_LG10G03014 [Camellia lanceoleosa]